MHEEGPAGLSLRDAIAAVTASGQLFEVTSGPTAGGVGRRFTNSPSTLREVFDAARGVAKTFVVYEGEEWTFAQVMEEVDGFAHALVHRWGVRRGDRVGIAMGNLPEWISAFAAIVAVGGVAVSLNAWWTTDELDFAIADADLRVMVADAQRCTRVLETCRRRSIPVVLVRGDVTSPAPSGVVHWGDTVVRGASMPLVDVRGEDDATILYTSGTTGQPKGAVSTHQAISQTLMAFSAGLVVEERRRGPRDQVPRDPTCFVLIVPLFHVTGCVPVMLSSFAWHFKLVMAHHWEPQLVLRLIEKYRVTNVVGVPTQSWDLVNVPDLSSYDTSSLVTVGGGGAPAAAALVARVEQSFIHARPNLAYGMTETNGFGPQIYGDDYQRHPASTGQTPTVVMDVEIRDDHDRVLAPDQEGEIWVSGPTLFRGYWRRPDETAQALVGGWLRTGDLGFLDDEGFLFVRDRVKDMIVRGGENVYCAEVESAICDHPAVWQCAVCGLPDERLGQTVAAVVVVRADASLSQSQLIEFLAPRLAPYKIPRRIAFTSEPLVASATGKVVKSALAARYFSTTA